jgi:hypothetical protein
MSFPETAHPNISHVWAGDDWTERQKAVYGSRLAPIFDLAIIGLEIAGIDSVDAVTVHLERVHEADIAQEGATLGHCIDDESYSVGVRKRHIWGPQLPTMFYQAALHSHEIAHVVRAKTYLWDERLIEYAATEGIAYHVQSTALREFVSPRHTTSTEVFLSERGEAAMEVMRQVFLYDACMRPPEDFVDVHTKWFVGPQKPGPALGMWCVRDLLRQGAEMRAIMGMPAEQILGLE